MFSNLVISILVGGGISAWIYSKIKRSSGGNTKHSVIAAAISALLIIIIINIVLDIVFKHLKKL